MSAVLQPRSYPKFTSADLAVLPEDGKLYEIIEGDLHVSRQPNWHHQFSCTQLLWALQSFNLTTLHAAPELMIEVMSPGWSNQIRDRQTKLKLYSRRGVEEYWIVDWQQRTMEIYRRENEQLTLTVTLRYADTLTSPLLPGFACNVAQLFFPPPVKSS